MSRKKEQTTEDFSNVMQWISDYKTIPLNRRGGTVKSELAKLLGVTKSSINYFEEHGVPMGRIIRFAKDNKVSVDRLFFGTELASRKVAARIYSATEDETMEPILIELYMTNSWRFENFRNTDLRIWVQNSTMLEPDIKKGEAVLINVNQTRVLYAGFYAIRVNHKELVLRHFIPQADGRVEELVGNPYRSVIHDRETIEALPVVGRAIKVFKDI